MRVLHRVFFRRFEAAYPLFRSGRSSTSEVMMDSIITARRSNRHAPAHPHCKPSVAPLRAYDK